MKFIPVKDRKQRKMDLLRLVLARQSANSLLRLPRLLVSRSFRTMRAEQFGYEDLPHFIECTSSSGELSERTIDHIPPDYIVARAIFLRDAERYLSVVGEVSKLDFWLAMESGIPEIQAKALSIYIASIKILEKGGREGKVNRDTLSSYNDLTSVPWTPRLREIIRDLLPTYHFEEEISGFLSLDMDETSMSFDYYVGVCKNFLCGKETTEEHSHLTRLYGIVTNPKSAAMKPYLRKGYRPTKFGDPEWQGIVSKYVMISGYLTPFVSMIRGSTAGRSSIEKYAVKYASHAALKMIIQGQGGFVNFVVPCPGDQVTTKWFRDRVRSIVNDEDLMVKLPKGVVAWYHCVMLQIHGDAVYDHVIRVGIPLTKNRAEIMAVKVRPDSLQGISYVDPRAVFAQLRRWMVFSKSFLPLGIDLYRKGTFLPEIVHGEGERRATRVHDTMYQSILAYLRGETETWET